MARVKRTTIPYSDELLLLRQETLNLIINQWHDVWFPVLGFEYLDFKTIHNKKAFLEALKLYLDQLWCQNYPGQMGISIDTIERFLNIELVQDFHIPTKNIFSIFVGYPDWKNFLANFFHTPDKPIENPENENKLAEDNYLPQVFSAKIMQVAYHSYEYSPFVQILSIPTHKNDSNKRKTYASIIAIICILLLCISAIYLYPKYNEYGIEVKEFRITSIDQDTTKGFPISMRIAYDLEYNSIADSVYIEVNDWNMKRNIYLTDKQGFVSLAYHYPAYPQVKLKYMGQTLDSIAYQTPTYGWQAFLTIVNDTTQSRGRLPLLPKNSMVAPIGYCIPDIYIPKLLVAEHFWSKYSNIGAFKIPIKNFTFRFVPENNEQTGGILCYDVHFKLITSTSETIEGTFESEGCSHYAYLRVKGITLNSSNYEHITRLNHKFLSGIKSEVKVTSKDNLCKLWLNNQEIMSLPIQASEEEYIVGYEITFKGRGILNSISIE